MSVDPVAALIAAAKASETNQPARNESLVSLHRLGTVEVFDRAAALCHSDDPGDRLLGVQILRELGSPARPFATETVRLLLSLGVVERDIDVRQWIASALTYQGREEALPFLIEQAQTGPPAVRHAIANNLTSICRDARVVPILVGLSADPDDSDTRYYATVALSEELDVDAPEIIDALRDRLGDRDFQVRTVAMEGLRARGMDQDNVE